MSKASEAQDREALEELGLLPGSWREWQRASVSAGFQPMADPRVRIYEAGLADLARANMHMRHQLDSVEREYHDACGVIDQLRVLLGHLRQEYTWGDAVGEAIDTALVVAEPFDRWGGGS